MKLGELATRLGCQLEGPADLEITGVAGMDEANAGEITFLSNPKYLPKLHTTHAGAIIADRDVDTLGKPVLRSADPYMSFAGASKLSIRPRGRRRESIPPPSSHLMRSWGKIPP